ncbi:hypothetical protein D3C78_1022680 [compost metagenome]
MFWDRGRGIALQRSVFGILGIRVGIRTQQIKVGRQRGFGFQFDPAGTDLAALDAGEYIIRIRHLVVGLGQLINRHAGSDRAILRCKLHAGFILLPFRGSEGVAVDIRAGSRLKGFTVADIRRNTVFKDIIQASPAGEFVVFLLGYRVLIQTVGAVGIAPVIAPPHGQHPLIPLGLILYVKPGLLLTIDLTCTTGNGVILVAVLWSHDIQRGSGAVLIDDVITHAHVVHPHQQGMINHAGGKFCLGLGVHRKARQMLFRVHHATRQLCRVSRADALTINGTVIKIHF